MKQNGAKEMTAPLVGESMSGYSRHRFCFSPRLSNCVVTLYTGSPTVVFYIGSSNPRSVTVTVTLIKRSARVHRVCIYTLLSTRVLVRLSCLCLPVVSSRGNASLFVLPRLFHAIYTYCAT